MNRLYAVVAGAVLCAAGSLAEAASCGCSLPSGRTLDVTSDTLWVTARNTADTCTISLGLKKVVVEPGRVLLGEKVITQINQSARAIAVTRKDGQLTVVADGQIMYRGGLR
ncbi:hypothetical protein Pan44_00460 [Caulifigura coniformis]|uniref:Uncharacterized protein n=1 Tax=Caulifigura coniformis TaxID=2527983 RepID=A0A517S7F1_9PLAN|nr:hypothetical protein [Caulifigura coniformis]QDT52039.1 hypothetical protein Pan44_00460 [Caulifigura coniformis]